MLTVPILAWNVAFTRYLPPALGSDEFWRNIPPVVAYGENTLRFLVVVLPFLMPFELTTARRHLAHGPWPDRRPIVRAIAIQVVGLRRPGLRLHYLSRDAHQHRVCAELTRDKRRTRT